MSDTFVELPMDIEDVTEPKAGPEGDYTLIVRDVQEKNNESGVLKNVLVLLDVVSAPTGVNPDEISTVMHNLSIPMPDDDQEKVVNKMRFIKRFMAVFAIPFAGNRLDLKQFPGKQAKCHLVQDEYQGNITNKIKLPNLK
jgi:hypothetical protein